MTYRRTEVEKGVPSAWPHTSLPRPRPLGRWRCWTRPARARPRRRRAVSSLPPPSITRALRPMCSTRSLLP